MHHNLFVQTGEDVKLANKFLMNFAICLSSKTERTLLIIPRPLGNKILDEIRERHSVKKFIDPSNSIKAIIVDEYLHICFITMSRSIKTLSRFIGENYNLLAKKYKKIIFASSVDNETYNENFGKYCDSMMVFDDIQNFANPNLLKVFKTIATLKKNNESLKVTDVVINHYNPNNIMHNEILIHANKVFGLDKDISTIILPDGYEYNSCFLTFKEPWNKLAVDLTYIGKRVIEK